MVATSGCNYAMLSVSLMGVEGRLYACVQDFDRQFLSPVASRTFRFAVVYMCILALHSEKPSDSIVLYGVWLLVSNWAWT